MNKRVSHNKLTTEIFIERSIRKHNGKYDYRLSAYVDSLTKVIIICPIHGKFEQNPHHHMKGHGCDKCAQTQKAQKLLSNTNEFIEKANEIHEGEYTYENVVYKSAIEKVLITCKKHGDFLQAPHSHLKGHGCKKCNFSIGEKLIHFILTAWEILHLSHHHFPDCKDKKLLEFDFYIPSENIIIEYDGKQHNSKVNCWGGNEGMKDRRKKDRIKNKYCRQNGIRMIRIKSLDKIESTLKDILLP